MMTRCFPQSYQIQYIHSFPFSSSEAPDDYLAAISKKPANFAAYSSNLGSRKKLLNIQGTRNLPGTHGFISFSCPGVFIHTYDNLCYWQIPIAQLQQCWGRAGEAQTTTEALWLDYFFSFWQNTVCPTAPHSTSYQRWDVFHHKIHAGQKIQKNVL